MDKTELYQMVFQSYDDLLDVKQATDLLDVSTKTVYKLIANGTLAAVKVGREHRIAKVSILEYLHVLPPESEEFVESSE